MTLPTCWKNALIDSCKTFELVNHEDGFISTNLFRADQIAERVEALLAKPEHSLALLNLVGDVQTVTSKMNRCERWDARGYCIEGADCACIAIGDEILQFVVSPRRTDSKENKNES